MRGRYHTARFLAQRISEKALKANPDCTPVRAYVAHAAPAREIVARVVEELSR